MVYTLQINYPNAAKGQDLSIPGLGTFANGTTYHVSKEEADAFKTYQRDNGLTDQTLLQAFKGNEFVVVETEKDEENSGLPPQSTTGPADSTTATEDMAQAPEVATTVEQATAVTADALTDDKGGNE